MNIVEKRKQNLITICYFTVVFVLYYFFMKYAFWVVAPFIFAFLFALVMQSPIRFLSKKTKAKRSFVAVFLVFLILSAVFGLVFFAGYKLFGEFRAFGTYIIGKLNDLPNTIETVKNWIIGFIDFLPDKMENTIASALNGFTSTFIETYTKEGWAALTPSGITENFDMSIITTPLDGIWSTAKKIPALFAAVLIAIIACFFLTADYDKLSTLIKSNISQEHEALLVKCKHLFFDIIGKMVKSYATIIFVTFCEVAIGLNILSFTGVYSGEYILVISICTALLDILPVFGTGTVLIPWAVISFFSKNIGLGIGLLILYALITVIRQILEPRLVAMNIGIPPIFTLAGMYLGLQLFGFIGLFGVPVTFVLVKMLNDEGIIHIWGREKSPESNNEDAEKTEQEPQIIKK